MENLQLERATGSICCAGEVMIELAAAAGDAMYRRDFAGDSFNSAIYLARSGLPVEYLTCLGDDDFSDAIIARLQEERIDIRLVRRLAGRQPGLYLINNDASGERHFTYWRDHSPARELFDQPLELAGIGYFYFTGITLAVCRSGLGNLVSLLEQLGQGGCKIIFDPNYREALWQSQEQARNHYRQVLPLCNILLSTLEDDTRLWGISGIEACRDFYQDVGVQELVIRAPDLTSYAYRGEEQAVQTAPKLRALDTTGAGDAYNAAYIAARFQGGSMDQAIDAAQALSATVVRHRGAITPGDGCDPTRKQ